MSARKARRQPKAAKKVPAIIIPEAVRDAIEEERMRLMKAHSVLKCVSSAMQAR